MDDLSKKRNEKTQAIIDGVTDTFSKAMKQKNLSDLYKRKIELEGTIGDKEKNAVTRANAKLQLKDINESIQLLEQEVSLTDEYDIDVDEEAAIEFLEKHNIPIEFEDVDFIHQDKILTELEESLGLPEERKDEE